jgi:integrase
VSKGTAGLGASSTRAYLVPQFGGMRLDGITSDGIEVWLAGFKKRGLSNASGNTALMFLRIMLGEAKRKGLIAANPCDGVKSLPKEEKKIDILTPEEVRALFPADWREAWADETHCVLNKLAACTGMRIGELLGLRGEYVFNGYITVAGQHGRYGYGDTKTHGERKIPIPVILENDLLRLKGINGDGYLFSNNGGKKPLGRDAVYNAFFAALERIEITKDERKKRNFSFHVWRHFFNTALLMANVPDSKVMSLTGHASKKMKERYTHFDTTKFSEVVEVQEKLLTDNSG